MNINFDSRVERANQTKYFDKKKKQFVKYKKFKGKIDKQKIDKQKEEE